MKALHFETDDICFIEQQFHYELKNLTKEIVKVRKQLNVSQARLAKLLGISVRTLESWERGRRNPSASAQALLRLFIRSPEFVLETLN